MVTSEGFVTKISALMRTCLDALDRYDTWIESKRGAPTSSVVVATTCLAINSIKIA
jgi:hypothetical protein